jgi:hypothetical protein
VKSVKVAAEWQELSRGGGGALASCACEALAMMLSACEGGEYSPAQAEAERQRVKKWAAQRMEKTKRI